MLQLQRASAGSGKTYTLAKKFIYFLITIKDHERGVVRLRTEAEIADGVSRILAITFTNKATAEMKLRIVEKLAALAASENKEITPKLLETTDYLEDFHNELKISYRQVAQYAKTALTALLNQYSDFHVSTIDSFFQSVLRTFAYESNLNDSYQVEIDSDYIASAAIDATLDEVNTSMRNGSHSTYWIDLLMNDASSEKGAVWNVFQKNTSDDTIYTKLRVALKHMDDEEFKEKRAKLDEYLATDEGASRLINTYKRLRGDIENMLTTPFQKMVIAKQEFEQMLAANGLNPKEDLAAYVAGHLEKIGNFKFDRQEEKWFKSKDLSGKKSVLKKGVNCGSEPQLTEKAREMYAGYEEWKSAFESERYRLWDIYSVTLPYLGLLLEAREKINSFLETNNLIQIGETNSMLMRIIGDSDTPFIYERLGTQLNHYLIDEFQDTSRMQWGNLNKLLRESESRDEDNLIIGDAKQSIYRFRNAEPSLITTVVAREFAKSINICGMSKEENTNWRSWRRIVEFNNFFFQALSKEVAKIQKETYEGEETGSNPDKVDFANLYSNVVQYPNKQEEKGYVEIRFFEAPAKEDKKYDDTREAEQAEALKEVGPLISTLIARGYSQKDIALLVDTKKLGNAVVDAIIEYNSTLVGDSPRIEFISEDSLVVSSSEAVGIIVSTLKKIAEGTISRTKQQSGGEKREGEERGKEGGETDYHKVNWNDIKSDYAFFALQHPQLTPSEQISEFLKLGSPIDAIREMMRGMQAMTLPSLVESIVENFVSEDLRKSQALFIAGFQDMVLDYCERYAADTASFLGWWESRGKFLSITSPEDTDAVRIMTIHKSKGLEFKCVILPFEAKGLTPFHKKTEWRWVEPSPVFKDYDLPGWLPIETTKKLLDTEYADIYRKYSDLYMMDKLNSLYVAFTRAKCELYIFSKYIDKDNTRASHTSSAWFLKEICGNMEQFLPEDTTDIISPSIQTADEDGMWITFGNKIDPKPEDESSKKNEKDEDVTFVESKTVEEYKVNSCPNILHCREGESAENEMRSEGTLLHKIMENVTTAADLHRSILSMKMRGAITSQQSKEWEDMLAEAMSDDRVKGWFDGSWRVLNERRILQTNRKTHRPDRIMLSRDGKKAVIVDYKFGEDPKDEAKDETFDGYRKQVVDYVDVLKEATGIRDVSAHIWYVRSRKIFNIVG